MPRYRPLAILALALIVVQGETCPVWADDGWNPFAQSPPERRRPRYTPPDDRRGTEMPSMDGVSSRPWATQGQGAGTGYGGGAPVESRPWRSDGFQPGEASGRSYGSPGVGAPEPSVQVAPLAPLAPVQRGDLGQPPAETGAPMTSPGAAPGAGPRSGPGNSNVPPDAWGRLDVAKIGKMVGELTVPPRSAALAALWRTLWTGAPAPVASSAGGGPGYDALRNEVLYRSGLVEDLKTFLPSTRPAAGDAVEQLLLARNRIAVGERDTGCMDVKAAYRDQGKLPKQLKTDLLLLAGLCGAGGGDPAAAGLAADLLRSETIHAPIALAALDAMRAKHKVASGLRLPKTLDLIQYRFLEAAGWNAPPDAVAAAEPALLPVLAKSAHDPATRVLAAEAALRINAITPADLAAAYKAASGAQQGARSEPAMRRAEMFASAGSAGDPLRRLEAARAFLEEAHRARLPVGAAAALADPISSILPSPETRGFAGTAMEVFIAAGRFDLVQLWFTPSPDGSSVGLGSWLALADIADPHWRGHRGRALPALEALAVSGRLAPEMMHRLVTVLDALDYQIPIPLWDAASRTGQPTNGYLPKAGVLSQLQQASRSREFANTVLLAMEAIGPETGASANIIPLGDTIKALKRAGLEADARRLGLEALYDTWPRSTGAMARGR
ncbi:MAG: hypothetical protein ACK5JT_06360 [Hyphomicrobiaceae bacterium]